MSKVHQTVDVGLKTFAPIKSSGNLGSGLLRQEEQLFSVGLGQLTGLFGVPDGLQLFVVGSNLVPVGLVDLIPGKKPRNEFLWERHLFFSLTALIKTCF